VTYVPPHLSKDQDIEIEAGDVIAVSTPGGGGFGPAAERPRPRSSATSRSATTAPTRPSACSPARARRHEGKPAQRARRRGDAGAEPVHRRLPDRPGERLVRGCLRTIDEIAAWGSLDDAAKRAVWKRLPVRRQALADSRDAS
jgi:hypothetical protein